VDDKYYLSEDKIKYILTRPKNFECKINPDKSNCLRTNYGNASANETYIAAQRGRNLQSGVEQVFEPRYDGKTNCITSVQKDNLVIQLNERQQRNYKELDEKANTFLSTSWKGSQANGMTLVNDTAKIRRLTPTECARLQTIPNWYKWNCSDTQKYKMLGNGWTIEIIKHILSYMPTSGS